MKTILKFIIVFIRYFLDLSVLGRNDLPLLLDLLGLKGEGVEIGVQKGEFSNILLFYSKLRILYSIDPWKEFDKKIYQDVSNVSQDKHEDAFHMTVQRLSIFGNRSKILRLTSFQANALFRNYQLDFVYIDAQHSYEACRKDINMWWPKVKAGGILAGHDYLNGKLPEGDFGVKQAVDEFISEKKLRLFVTNEQWPTWYVIKK